MKIKSRLTRQNIFIGLSWGFAMFLFVDILIPMIEKEPIEDWNKLTFRFIYWLLFGLVMGLLFFKAPPAKEQKTNSDPG